MRVSVVVRNISLYQVIMHTDNISTTTTLMGLQNLTFQTKVALDLEKKKQSTIDALNLITGRILSRREAGLGGVNGTVSSGKMKLFNLEYMLPTTIFFLTHFPHCKLHRRLDGG